MSLLEITVDVNGKTIPVTTKADVVWLRGIVGTLLDQMPQSKHERLSMAGRQAWTEERKAKQGERMREVWQKRREADSTS